MSKLSKDKRDKIILVGLVTAAASAAIWLLVIRSQSETLKNVRAEAVKSRDQLKRGQTTLGAQAQINESFESATQKLKQRESAMAAPNDMYSWLIQTLNTFRLGYQVEIPQFGRELPSEVGIFPKFPYRAALFNVRGSAYYHDFGRFLADFENAFPYIRVQNIELDAAGESGSSRDAGEKLSFKMELLTLVRPTAQ
jgi:Tfp pilus assembly protein PilO